jgi:hypothetical protein
MKIWIPKCPKDDVVAWYYEKNGAFALCSAYRVAMQQPIQEIHLASMYKWFSYW